VERALLVPPEQQAQQVRLERLDPLVLLVPLVQMVRSVLLESQAQRDLLERMVLTVRSARRGRLAQQVRKGSQALLALLVLPERRDLLARLEQPV